MVVDLFLVYQFIRRLATPFEKWPAYKTGVIDKEGNILKGKKERNIKSEKDSFGKFDLMILKLKKLLAKVPGGSSRFASYAAALFLIKEWKHFTDDSLLNESVSEENIDRSLNLFLSRYNHYNTLSNDVNHLNESDTIILEKLKASDDMGDWIDDFYKSDAPQFKGKSKAKRRQMAIAAKLGAMDEEIHPDVIKAYKNLRNAEHRDGEYGTTATKRSITRTANTLSKKINQHHPDLDMKGKIKLRTQLQNMHEDLQEGAKPMKWKKAGPNGEIETTVNGQRFKIEKALDHNLRHKGEYKVYIWDKRSDDWEWDDTVYGKTNAKARVFFHLKEEAELEEEPANNVGSGNIAGMDGGHMSKAGQKKWTASNKTKNPKRLRDIIGANK